MDDSESSNNEESSSDDATSDTKSEGEKTLAVVISKVGGEVIASLETMLVYEDMRLATSILVLAVIPPFSYSSSTSGDNGISLASNYYIGLPAQSPVSPYDSNFSYLTVSKDSWLPLLTCYLSEEDIAWLSSDLPFLHPLDPLLAPEK